MIDGLIRRPVLTNAETVALLRRWRASLDRGEPDYDARNAAVEGNLGLVGFALRWARRIGLPTAHDAREHCYLQLIKAASKFDPDRGTQFNTYAVKAIKVGLLRQRGSISLIYTPAEVQTADGGRYGAAVLRTRALASLESRPACYELADHRGGPRDESGRSEDRAYLERLIDGLREPRWRAAVRCRLAGGTQDEAAAALGVTRARAGQIEARAVEAMARAARAGHARRTA